MTAVPDILDEADEGELLALPDGADEAAVLAFTDRLLRELGDVQRERDANERACKAEVLKVQNGWADVNGALKRREDRMEGYLERLVLLIPMRGKRSRDLGAGTLGWRFSKARLEITDQDAVVAWVKANLTQGDRAAILEVVPTEKLRKAKLDEYALSTGEIPAGAVLKPAADVFYVTPREAHP